MPYYKWRGVNLFGDIKKGRMFAKSSDDLDDTLFNQSIALIASSKVPVSFLLHRISSNDKINFFRQLSVLIDSGVRLPESLRILMDQAGNMKFRQIIFSIESDIQEGNCLGDALQKYPEIFDDLMIKMVCMGQESGKLGSALHMLSDYLEERQSFYKKLKSAALLPLITLAFFSFIAFSIFIFIIPKFEDVFRSMNKELPVLTKYIFKASKFLGSNMFVFALILLILFGLIIRKYFKSDLGKKVAEKLYLNFPFVGKLVCKNFLVYFLNSMSVLLENGVRLVSAMNVTKKSFKTSFLCDQIAFLEKEITDGSSLSESMVDAPGQLFSQDLVAIVRVGEETGRLSLMLKKAADMYQQKLNRSILFFTTIFQPLLMIFLGLLIALLIFAIYIPVFSLSGAV